MIRALIVDDEAAARERVRMMLAAHDDVVIAGECTHGIEARDTIASLRPDVIFLDIEMPRLDGMALLEGLPAAERPVVLLVTAHSRHAVDAFDFSPADYLLKPFTQERFDRALQRARRAVAARRAMRSDARLAFKQSRGKVVFVRGASIRFITSEGNYSRVHMTDRALLVRETIQSLEEHLDPTTFVRIHRAAIVNVNHVVEMHHDPDGRTSVTVSPSDVLPVGPKFRARIERALAPELTRLER